MNSTCRTAIAAAVAGGYVLGRTRKAKAAFAIGTLLAGRRFGLTPTALAGEGLRRLRESPQLADLREQIGGDLMDAVRAAASASADRRFSAFAGTLRDRVQEKGTGEEPEDETYDETDDEADADEDYADGPDEEERDEEERDEDERGGGGTGERADRSAARRRGSGHERKRTGKGTAKKAAKKPAKKAAPASRSAAKKARPATKTASKKAASGRSHATTSRRGR